MSTLIFSHPACLAHDAGADHPERPARLRAVLTALRDASLPELAWREAPCASGEQLARVHDTRHVDRVFTSAPETGYCALDPDTVMAPGSLEAARRAAGAGIAAVDAVLGGEAQRAFCAVRPPGHHATRDTAMGFCLFNNVALAAAHALDAHGLQRLAIADFDVHHGNGTEAIFADDARVLYLSSHQMPLYPATGKPQDNTPHVRNAALPPGSGSQAFRQAWRDALLPALDAFAPQLLLVSAGFDADERDPLAQIELGPDDYRWITRELVTIAERHASGRLVSTLEGGYDLAALADGVVAHVRAL